MATLERRVQVLFDPERYAELEAEAVATHQSVGALIREAVEERLDRRRQLALEALDRLWARADSDPVPGPENWEEEKEALVDRDVLRDIP